MELVTIITVMLSIFFSGLLPHYCCASRHLPLMKPSLPYQVNAHHLSLPPFPRKLMSTEQQVKEHEATTHGASRKNNKENFSGNEEEKEQKMKKKKKGTRQEWVQGDDPSLYFTTDYSRVRRRRPIHNKNIPVAP